MPYDGVATSLSTYRQESAVLVGQDTLVARLAKEIRTKDLQIDKLDDVIFTLQNKSNFQEKLISTQEGTIKDLSSLNTTLYEITQKPKFRLPIWIPTTVGAIVGGAITYKVMTR
jgi:hypothetical protein